MAMISNTVPSKQCGMTRLHVAQGRAGADPAYDTCRQRIGGAGSAASDMCYPEPAQMKRETESRSGFL
jgi:hypothetical protein